MKPQQAVIKPKRACVLKSTVVGSRRLIQYESFLQALKIEPDPGIERPVTITIKKAQQLSGLSRATINRMITAGESADAAA